VINDLITKLPVPPSGQDHIIRLQWGLEYQTSEIQILVIIKKKSVPVIKWSEHSNFREIE
jgi:hypothetical protein